MIVQRGKERKWEGMKERGRNRERARGVKKNIKHMEDMLQPTEQ